MVDQVDQEEEYHFQDLGSTEPDDSEQVETQDEKEEQVETQESSKQTETQQVVLDNSSTMKKKIFMAAGGVILLIVGYNSIDSFFGDKKAGIKSNVIKKSKQLSSAIKPINNVNKQSSTQITQKSSVISVPEEIIVQKKSTTNNASSDINAEIIEQTKSELQLINSVLASIEMSLKDLDFRLIDLHSNQEKLKKEFIAQKQASLPSKKSKTPKKIRKKGIIKGNYSLIGLIHGRAWLKTPDGSTLTVKPGDRLRGHKVKLIEPEQGVVIMSSGDVIKFDEDNNR